MIVMRALRILRRAGMVCGLLALLLGFQIVGCAGQTSERTVTFKTADGWTIVGSLYSPKEAAKAKGAVILLHQRGGQANDWLVLCRALQAANITALAIDQRGAGRSTEGPGGKGEDAPWQTGEDIRAAIAFLKSQQPGAPIGLTGASYGANNALIYAASHSNEVKGLALYSPGADYHGLLALKPARSYAGPVVIYHDRNDTIAGDGPRQINALLPGRDHTLKISEGSEHGSGLLSPANIRSTVTFWQNGLH